MIHFVRSWCRRTEVEGVDILRPSAEETKRRVREALQCPLLERLGLKELPLCRHGGGHGGGPGVGARVALAATYSFAELCPFVQSATVSLSFWGARQLHFVGYEGAVPIDALVLQILRILEQNPDFDQIERSHGKRIAPWIDRIYTLSDEQVAASHWITQLFIWLRDLPTWYDDSFRYIGIESPTFRRIWRNERFEEGYCHIFSYYTKAQHESVFGPIPEYSSWLSRLLGTKRLRPITLEGERCDWDFGREDREYWAPETPFFSQHQTRSREELVDGIRHRQFSIPYVVREAAAHGCADILQEVLNHGLVSWERPDPGAVEDQIRDLDCGEAVRMASFHNQFDCVFLLLETYPDKIFRARNYVNVDHLVQAISLAEYHGNGAALLRLRQWIE